jgi:uncharacterized YccA/Bax inhibitor family protein
MESGNPVLGSALNTRAERGEKTATVQGVAVKTLLLMVCLAVAFGAVWREGMGDISALRAAGTQAGQMATDVTIPKSVIGFGIGGALIGFALAMCVIFNPRSAPCLAPFYAAMEGMALAAISLGFEAKFPGIVMQAVGGTAGALLIMLLVYASGLLRPTEGFVVGLLAAMGGIIALYTVDLLMSIFGGGHIAAVHDSSPLGIGLQVVIVIVASLNLIVDFGTVTDMVEDRAPKWMEWYGAFGIMVTLVWLYLEILRLLAKIYDSSSSGSSSSDD